MALDDIRLAFESGYPEELRFKLIERKVWCFVFELWDEINRISRLKMISFSMV